MWNGQGCRTGQKTVLALVLGVLAAYPGAATKKTDREQAALVGPVRSVYTEEAAFFERFLKWVEGSKVPISAVCYDVQGNMTDQVEYNPDGSPRIKWTYNHNEKGYVTVEVEYDTAGTIQSKWTYTYTPEGHMTESAVYGVEGSLTEKVVYVHDERGLMTAAARYDADGSLRSNRLYVYDCKGSMVQWIEYKADGTLGEKMVFTYNDKGYLTGYEWYDSDGSVKRKVFPSGEERVSSGIAAEQLGKKEGKTTARIVEEPEKTRYTYEYDSRGNWVKKTTSKWTTISRYGNAAFIPSKVEYRTIAYH